MPEQLTDKWDKLRLEFSQGRDNQGRVLSDVEKLLAITHLSQQEFIIRHRTTDHLAILGETIDWSVIEGEGFRVISPNLRKAVLISASTYGLVLFSSVQGSEVEDNIKQHWIKRVSAIADRVEKGIDYPGRVRLSFYDLKDAFFARCGNFMVGFGIKQAHSLHTQVLTELNSINYLMRVRLKGAYDELDDAFRMSRLITKLNIYRNESDGFSQANQADMVEMLFRFYQGLTFTD